MIRKFFSETIPRYGQVIIFSGGGVFFYQGLQDNRLKIGIYNH